MKEIKISAPATVANVSCGFDVLGFVSNMLQMKWLLERFLKKELELPK